MFYMINKKLEFIKAFWDMSLDVRMEFDHISCNMLAFFKNTS